MTDQKDFHEYYHALRRQIKTQYMSKSLVITPHIISSRKVPETYRLQKSSTTAHSTQQTHFLEPEKATVNPPIKKWVRSPYLIVKRAKQNTSP
ncbi:hypothetical protein CEXT_749841 [Caerostris extrusa]|uniref:Uncharacterized protein n=1 Tax=Caerostris extrusa TaxID=172846 RepID=A0AAV4NB78_CAEEX|nr:hypothetical protein CEXT_749841 [Caerostris extrusa]